MNIMKKSAPEMPQEQPPIEDGKAIQLAMQVEEDLVCENSEEEVEKHIQESEQTVKSFKSKRKKTWNVIFFLLNIILVAVILFDQISKEEILPISELFALIKPWYVLCVIGMFLFSVLVETINYNMLIKKSTKRNRPWLSYKVYALGRYYDDITPMAAGGQPFQIFYLSSRGVDPSSSIFVPMSKYVVNQITWIVFSIVILIYSIKKGFGGSFSVIGIASIVSLTLNGLVLFFTLILSMSKKLGKKLVVNGLKFLQKIRIVKNYEKQYIRVMKVVSDYQSIMRSFTSDIWFFIKLVILGFLKLISIYAMPAFIYCCFYGFNLPMMLEVMCVAVMIDLAAGFVPVPGGAGFTEISFTALFGAIFGGVVFWAMIMWRIMNFYLILAQGLVVITYDYFFGNKKFKWQQRKWELELESDKFKQAQLKDYKKRAKNFAKIRSK